MVIFCCHWFVSLDGNTRTNTFENRWSRMPFLGIFLYLPINPTLVRFQVKFLQPINVDPDLMSTGFYGVFVFLNTCAKKNWIEFLGAQKTLLTSSWFIHIFFNRISQPQSVKTVHTRDCNELEDLWEKTWPKETKTSTENLLYIYTVAIHFVDQH